MKQTYIWHVSRGSKFPLRLNDSGPLQPVLKTCSLEELEGLAPSADVLHVFLIQLDGAEMAPFKQEIKKAHRLDDFPKLIIVPDNLYEQARNDFALVSRTYVIDDSTRTHHLHLLVELVVHQEYYRQLLYDISGELRRHSELFENMQALTSRELKNITEESKAYQGLQEFEENCRKFEVSTREAMSLVNELKDEEMHSIKEEMSATERLSEYRVQELRAAHETIEATRAALEFSREENLRRDELLEAMDRLRSFTEKEMIELFEENKELRKKLGLSGR